MSTNDKTLFDANMSHMYMREFMTASTHWSCVISPQLSGPSALACCFLLFIGSTGRLNSGFHSYNTTAYSLVRITDCYNKGLATVQHRLFQPCSSARFNNSHLSGTDLPCLYILLSQPSSDHDFNFIQTPTITMADSRPPFPFLQLPMCLQDKIIELAIQSRKEVSCGLKLPPLPGDKVHYHLQLTCRQFKAIVDRLFGL